MKKKPTARRAYVRRGKSRHVVAIADPTQQQVDLAKWVLSSHLNGKLVKQPPKARRAAEDVLVRAMRPRIHQEIVVPYSYTTATGGPYVSGSTGMLRNSSVSEYSADAIGTVSSSGMKLGGTKT